MGSLFTEPAQHPFPLYNSGSFPCPWETCMWLIIITDTDCTSLLIPNKLNFVGEMSGSLLLFQVNRGDRVAMLSMWTQGQERCPTEKEEGRTGALVFFQCHSFRPICLPVLEASETMWIPFGF